MKLVDIISGLKANAAALDRIRDDIAKLASFQRGGRRHMNLSDDRQRLLREREQLRNEQQRLYQRS